ncbi:Rv3654c family TadE-like protein [Nocardioides sp.]|uniref:Rv3654c family TadE-like protein n=1 Tax=Nocardioides sp. TaxID=35761 RepID=UPI002B2650F8|nr:Rv3654c family TadE-like protein [Nocardioides sp.]
MGEPERGAATVLAVALLGLLVLVACGLSVVAAIFVGHRTAQSAADLAALAGAAAVASGGDPCSAAGSVAQANGAGLAQCSVQGREVVVTVAVPGPGWRGWEAGDLTAESRAGPARS